LIDAIGKVTSLQVPHRLADAILRDSQIDGIDFRKSEKGKGLNTVSPTNATSLFALCPTALVFGMWDSTGPRVALARSSSGQLSLRSSVLARRLAIFFEVFGANH
jgi:CRISPR-associated protein Csb1